MTTSQIRRRLDMILEFMQPYWELVNCHMVNYFRQRHWHRYIPLDIQNEIRSQLQVRQCIERYFWCEESRDAYPAIAKFIELCEAHRLSNFDEILMTVQELQNELEFDFGGDSNVSVKEFMTDKKRHEVELTAKLVHDLIGVQSHDESIEEIFIIDAGDGKGYLSSRLALQYGHKVLGIDANQTNTENALARSRKLQRAWKGLVKRAELLENGITPPRRGRKPKKSNSISSNIQINNTYCTTARFIDNNLDMTNLLRKHFPQSIKTPIICLTGLHTCGNLAATCLRVFHANENCKILCNIGCCYHFLKEAFTTNELEHTNSNLEATGEASFPMSNFLTQKNIKMGRNARMLAAQCIERTLDSRELPNVSLFYRALLEVLLRTEFPNLYNENESIQVGRLRKFQNFSEYVKQCAKKKSLEELHLVKEEKIISIESIYNEDRAFLELFYLLRMIFAPILETLILLDRLLYLKELGYERSYLVSTFNAIVSPRHYAIVALKALK